MQEDKMGFSFSHPSVKRKSGCLPHFVLAKIGNNVLLGQLIHRGSLYTALLYISTV